MILVAITALLAVCNADKLDRTYLPPSSAQTAGGSPGAIQAPFPSIKAQGNQGLGGLPQGGFENEYDGVVVDAASTGSRTNGATGLGAPRKNYGSTHSKVGEAAFKETHVNQGQAGISQRQPSQGFTGQQGAQIGQDQGFGSQASLQQGGQQTTQFGQLNQDFTGQSFQGAGNNQFDNIPGQFSNTPQKPERAQAASDRNANIIRYESDVNSDKFNYAFETDNGIVAEENAVNNNGIQAQGGFSYTGDDGQVYSVTYTADEGGYQPKGSHLPTPPPIPEEILKSLEKNAQDEAAGIIDDGSYNPQKYNVGSGYTQSEIDSGKYNGSPTNFGSRPGLNKPSESFANYEQPSKPLFGNNALASNSNPSYQFESTSGKLNQPSGNNFDLNNKYSPANNRFQNGKPGLNKAQVPSNTFDKLVENSSQGEDQGQDMSTKPESNNAPFGISEGGNRRPSFGNLNQNRPSTTFEQNAVGNNDQQRPFGRPQKTGSSQVGFSQTTPQPAQYSQSAAQDVSNVESNDFSGSQFNGQQIQGGFNQQKPSNFNDFSESVSSSNKEYLPPFNHIKQNGRPQAPNSGFQFSKPSFTSRPPSLPLQPSQHGFQQNSQIPGRFPSSFGQPSRFGSQSSNNGFDKAPTSPPDTMLTTPFESTNQYSTINSGLVPSDFSRVEVEAQKEQLTNLQPSPPLPQFASSFAANLQKYQTASQNTQQNNRKPTFGTNFNSLNQNSQPSTQFSTTSTTQEQKEQLANVPLSPSTPSSQFASSFAANLQKYQTSSQNTQQNNRQPSFGTNFNSFNQNRKPSAQFATTTEAQNEQVTNLQPFPIPSQFASSFAANAGKYQTAPQNTQQNNRQPSFGENFNSFNQNKQPSVQFETTTDSQKEQFTNLQPFPSTPPSQFASSFAANAGKYQSAPQNTQQNNRQPSFGTNFNSYNQNRQPSPQFATTTAKPLFDQPQYQGADDSYYYNQPSQAFNTPSNQNPDRFLNVQFNIPFDSNRENLQDAGLIHTTTVTYPRPPTVAPTVATSSSQKDLGLGPIPQTGSVTDATASSFTSDTSNSQGQASFPQRPSFGFSANRPLRPNTQQSFAQNSSEPETPQKGPSAFNQQYQGEIYEYKKPDTMLPAQPEKDNTDQTSDNFTGSTSQSQFPSSQNESGLNKPPCCKRPTGRPSVFPVTSDSENSEPTQDDKGKPEKLIQGFNPNNYQPSNTNFAGESFGGPRKPPSFDAQTGYHY